MIKICTLFCVFCLITNCGTSYKDNKIISNSDDNISIDAKKYAATITASELKKMLYKYASDEFEGRETGEKGQKMAVDYLKAQYVSLGISSPLSETNYFQKVPLERQKNIDSELSINTKVFNNFEHYIVLTASKRMTISTDDIIYVGYGIDVDHYSDYKSVNVKGKVVLAKAGEPKDNDGNYITSGTTEDTKWTRGRQSLSKKREAAKKNGAKALLYMDDTLFETYAPYIKAQTASKTSKQQLLLKPNENDIAMLMISKKLGKAIHPSITENEVSKPLNTTLNLDIEYESETVISENVVAYIKGLEKPDEIIVISAHLDHEGVKNGAIYNGADDDGSGTVAILEIAEAFKLAQKEGCGPKRSLLFLHVTGEEKGLLGSRYYTDYNPIFPLKNTIANLNIDMIGRTDPKRKKGKKNYIYLIGSDKLSTDLHTISEAANTKYCNIELDYTYNDKNDPNRFYYRSDHYNFAKNNIPVIFYFNGTHKDYHKPSDTPDKIEYDLLENRARLVFHTAWEIANRDEKIVVDKAKK